MFFTYIVTNKYNGALYTGHTDDIYRRMEQHIHKTFPGFAADNNCHKLIWFEEHRSRHAAFVRERRIKAWKRVWKINMIERDNPYWIDIHAYRQTLTLDDPIYPLVHNPDAPHSVDNEDDF